MTLIKPCDDFWNEERIPLKSLGVDRHINTLRQWIEVGVRSRVTNEVIQMEAIYEGREMVSTKQAYDRFLKKLNGFE